MVADLEKLRTSPRVLIEASLSPVLGHRIQPTGFPDLGPARYSAPDGTEMLLVESAQSMANRLEAVCWDEATDSIAPELAGLPHVVVKLEGMPGSAKSTTCSLLEFHRLNSPYIVEAKNSAGDKFLSVLRSELGMAAVASASAKKGKGKPATDPTAEGEEGAEKEPDDSAGVVDLQRLAAVCLKYDPNSLIHGLFLEKVAGRQRFPRALSAFIEASGANRVDSGGVKLDRVLPAPSVLGVSAAEGYGNVPFHRTEFAPKSITAYFSIDLAQIRGYRLGPDAEQLLVALSLWKIRKFLDSNMRLRTACELELVEPNGLVVKRPTGFQLPASEQLEPRIRELIGKCRAQFSDPAITHLTWTPQPSKKEKA